LIDRVLERDLISFFSVSPYLWATIVDVHRHTASEPCTMKKGVNPVARHGVVRRLHNPDGTSATHLARNLSSCLKIHGFKPCRIMSFTLLTCPFVFGWATAD
jgi:hypothetical protein